MGGGEASRRARGEGTAGEAGRAPPAGPVPGALLAYAMTLRNSALIVS